MQSVHENSFYLHKSRIMSASLTLPDHFEVVVVGTGLVESIVAAAAARQGHTVLHIDHAGYYGGDFASFTLEGLQNWILEKQGERGDTKEGEEGAVETTGDNKLDLQEGEELLKLENFQTIENIQQSWQARDNPEENSRVQPIVEIEPRKDDSGEGRSEAQVTLEDEIHDSLDALDTKEEEIAPATLDNRVKEQEIWSKEKLLKESRRFNLDLTPRLLYARGSMVELLISSNISRYTEFKSITRVLTQIAGRLEHVPSSRSDVFGTKHISVVEKRILMKFLSACVNQSEDDILKGYENKPFRELLVRENLTENLIHFVLHSIAMVRPEASTEEGLSQTRKFLSSLGRFGSTPFLWSMYGSGELPQAFCRLCAVFGGVYYLGRNLSHLVVKDGRCVGIVTEGKRISCDYLVLQDSSTPSAILPEDYKQERTQRCTYITQASLLPTKKEQLTLLSLPTQEPLHIIEVGPGTAACPKGLQVVHASTRYTGLDVDSRIRDILPLESILYSVSFLQTTRIGDVGTSLSNVFHASGPRPELDFDAAVQQGREIFLKIFPDEEFLPRAPDPEEIIIGEENEETGAAVSNLGQSDLETVGSSTREQEASAETDSSIKDVDSNAATHSTVNTSETEHKSSM